VITVSGGQSYGSQVMGGAGNYGGVGLIQQSMMRKPDSGGTSRCVAV